MRDLYRTASLEEARAILARFLFEAEGASDVALVPWGRTLKRWKNVIPAHLPRAGDERLHRRRAHEDQTAETDP